MLRLLATLAAAHAVAAHPHLRPAGGLAAPPVSASGAVTGSQGNMVFVPGGGEETPGALAWGTYAANLQETGWDTLYIASSPTLANNTLAGYAAGWIEGYLTFARMEQFAANTGALLSFDQKLTNWLDSNWAWMQATVANPPTGEEFYWAHLGALLAQLVGQFDGQAAAGGQMFFQQVYNAVILGGDIFSLGPLYSPSTLSGKRRDHCSALVRLLPEDADIGVAHTTWSGYENMGRIAKSYDLPLGGGGAPVPGRKVRLSGYPLLLQYSSDDFYTIPSSGLITLETTINNDNATLARAYGAGATTQVVLEWARNVLANRLATDGMSWAGNFSLHASGTYTNSWMIVDTKQFVPGHPPESGTLVVVEEMPGTISVVDQSDHLRTIGYWASYNVPSDPHIFKISGQQALVDKYGGITGPGAFFSYANTSRARIFDRDAPNVANQSNLQTIIRYNNAPNDPLSTLFCGTNPKYSYTNAISDRSDLNQKGGDYKIPELGFGDAGGIDGKVTWATWLQTPLPDGVTILGQSGPTHDNCPVFDFSTTKVTAPHQGYPDKWDFGWIGW